MNIILLPIMTVFSRAYLNVFDRRQLKKNKFDLHLYLLINCAMASIIGLLSTYMITGLEGFRQSFFSWESLAWSMILQLVSFAFTYNLREQSIREVILSSKIGDLFLAPSIMFMCFLFFPNDLASHFGYSFKSASYFLAIISIFPLFLTHSKLSFIRKKSSIFLIGAILIQCMTASIFKSSFQRPPSILDHWNLSLSIILWRVTFSIFIYLILKIKNPENKQSKLPSFYEKFSFWQSFFRSIFMLLSYSSFILSIKYTNPVITLPIINSTPLVASLMAKKLLKEPLLKVEIAALSGLCLSAMI